MSAKPKFVVLSDNTILIGKVTYHAEYSKQIPDDVAIIGGGLWFLSDDSKSITFHGLSTDFGPVHEDKLLSALQNSKEYLDKNFESVKVFKFATYEHQSVLSANIHSKQIYKTK